MFSFSGLQTKKQQFGFDIVQAFFTLESARKLALYDSFSQGSSKSFHKTVALIWPQATAMDTRKLERLMMGQIAANDA